MPDPRDPYWQRGLRPLPIRVRPMPRELIISYLRRLANANRVDRPLLIRHIATDHANHIGPLHTHDLALTGRGARAPGHPQRLPRNRPAGRHLHPHPQNTGAGAAARLDTAGGTDPTLLRPCSHCTARHGIRVPSIIQLEPGQPPISSSTAARWCPTTTDPTAATNSPSRQHPRSSPPRTATRSFAAATETPSARRSPSRQHHPPLGARPGRSLQRQVGADQRPLEYPDRTPPGRSRHRHPLPGDHRAHQPVRLDPRTDAHPNRGPRRPLHHAVPASRRPMPRSSSARTATPPRPSAVPWAGGWGMPAGSAQHQRARPDDLPNPGPGLNPTRPAARKEIKSGEKTTGWGFSPNLIRCWSAGRPGSPSLRTHTRGPLVLRYA